MFQRLINSLSCDVSPAAMVVTSLPLGLSIDNIYYDLSYWMVSVFRISIIPNDEHLLYFIIMWFSRKANET